VVGGGDRTVELTRLPTLGRAVPQRAATRRAMASGMRTLVVRSSDKTRQRRDLRWDA
jgi:hypothetical protein